jgi:hypothetical protein
MNAIQKRAWFVVAVTAATVVCFLGLLPFIGAGATGAFGLLGLTGLQPLIGRREKFDERDQAIWQKAAGVSFALSYMAFVFCCMGVWEVGYMLQDKEQISIHVLPHITMICGFGVFLAQSVVILVLYARQKGSDDVQDHK